MKKVVLFLFVFVFVMDSFANGIGANVTNPVCDDATLSQYNGTVNVEINWEPNRIGLSWYDGDTQLSVPAESQSCVYDGDMNIPPQPTKTGYTFKGWQVIPLIIPAGYTRLEYIESTVTTNQYIDTGIRQHYQSPLTFEFSFRPANIDGSGWMGGNAYTQVNITSTYGFLLNTDGITKVVYDGEYERVYYNGVLKVTSPWVSAADYDDKPVLLFALGMGGTSVYGYAKGAMYYAKIFNESNEMVRYFIPARRNSDNEIGMYDTVTGTFFTNAGIGAFVAGPVIQ